MQRAVDVGNSSALQIHTYFFNASSTSLAAFAGFTAPSKTLRISQMALQTQMASQIASQITRLGKSI